MQHSDENFLKLEAAAASCRDSNPDIWEFRVKIFDQLAEPAQENRPNRFKFGVFSYLVWLAAKCCKTQTPHEKPPAADFLVLIYGTTSKEFDTLQPVIRKLSEAGHSVLVLWVNEETIPPPMVHSVGDSDVWHVSLSEVIASSRWYLPKIVLQTFGFLVRAACCFRQLNGIASAFWLNGSGLFDYVVQLRLWGKFLQAKLAGCDFKGIALVSDASPPGGALTRIAATRSWPTHHFLHGLPSLTHIRTRTTDVYCFSTVDREYFINHGWMEQRVHACGHPRQSWLMDQISKVRSILPIEGGLRMLFAGQGFDKMGFTEEHDEQTTRCVLEAARLLELTAEEFRYRPHPEENPLRFFQLAKAYPIRFDNSVLSRRPIADDLAWANVVITPFSTMAIEACYAGCFLIWIAVEGFRFEVRENLIASKYGHKSTSAEGLARELSICRNTASRARLIEEFQAIGKELSVLSEGAAGNAARIMTARCAKPAAFPMSK